MANSNRHLRGDTNEIKVPVHGHTVVEQGDIMVINQNSATIKVVHKTADQYGFPVTDLANVSQANYVQQLAGIAMNGSKNGTTNDVNVATSGIFRMALPSAKTIYGGWLVSGASSAVSVAYNQKVVCSAAPPQVSLLGRCVKSEASATNCDFELLTKFSGVSFDTLTL